jgi:hypothetical protein
VKTEIARAVSLRFAEPKFKCFERFFVATWTDHFDKRRRPANERGLAGGFVRVFRERSHERQINVDMRIDEPGKNIFASGVDDFRSRRGWRSRLGCGDLLFNACDGFVFAEDVSDVTFARSNDFTVFDEKRHNA